VSVENAIGLAVALALLVYLVSVLLAPERLG
jgi:K+-transporting ATPase KdpF subunit